MNSLKVGSAAWREFVFSTEPVRVMNGQQRPSVRVAPIFNGVKTPVDGATRILALYILEYLQLCGVIRRWKIWPFEWTPHGASRPTAPFVLAEFAGDQQLCVLQVRARRYLTAVVQNAFEAEAKLAESAGMRHVVWTDEAPLNAGARRLFFLLRGARTTECASDDIDALVAFVRDRQRVTIREIAEAGHAPSLIFPAVRLQRLFLPLTERPGDQTLVTTVYQTDPRAFFMQCAFDPQAWWKRLPCKVEKSVSRAGEEIA